MLLAVCFWLATNSQSLIPIAIRKQHEVYLPKIFKMKKHILFSAFFAGFLGFTALCQVSESEASMSLGSYNALTITLEVSDRKLVEKTWKDFMEDYGGKTKKVKGGDEWLTTGAEIVGINGVNSLQIYADASGGGEGGNVEMTVWFHLGNDEYLSRSGRKEQYPEAEKMLLKFALKCKIEHTKNELEDAEKKFKNLGSDFDKLKRQNDGYHKDIAEAEKKIETAKENIVKNEEAQTDTTQKIELQQQLVEEIKRRLTELKAPKTITGGQK